MPRFKVPIHGQKVKKIIVFISSPFFLPIFCNMIVNALAYIYFSDNRSSGSNLALIIKHNVIKSLKVLKVSKVRPLA